MVTQHHHCTYIGNDSGELPPYKVGLLFLYRPHASRKVRSSAVSLDISTLFTNIKVIDVSINELAPGPVTTSIHPTTVPQRLSRFKTPCYN